MPTVAAIRVTCPECGATAQATADVVKCQYCGTESHVQRRTQVLQRPIPIQQTRMPVAVQQRTSGGPLLLVFLVVPILIGAVIAMTVIKAPRSRYAKSSPSVTSSQPEPAPPPVWYWHSERPLLVDVDGDGVEDLIGLLYYGTGDRYPLAALSGADGHVLWETQLQVQYPLLAYANGTLLVAGTTGVALLEGRDPKTGKVTWTITPQEVVDKLCRDGDDRVKLVTKDEAQFSVTVATGTIAPMKKSGKCQRLAQTSDNNEPDSRLWAYSPPGMSHSGIRGEPGSWIISGHKDPGSGTPMIASVDDAGRVKWKTQLPATNPIAAAELPFGTFGLDATTIAAAYEPTNDNKHAALVVLDRATGARRYEVALDTMKTPFCTTVTPVIGPTLIAVTLSPAYLIVIDKATGKLRWQHQ